jgi:hypothetical protein
MTPAENQQTKSFWSDHVKQWQASGLSQAAYCRLHDLCQHKFSYRKRQSSLCKVKPDAPTGFARIQVDTDMSTPPSSDHGLSLRFDDGTCIEGITENNLVLVQPLLAVLR